MMSKLLFQSLLIVIFLENFDSLTQNERPKISTNDGHLVLEPGFNKNIYLRNNGPQSTIIVSGVDLLNASNSGKNYGPSTSNQDLDKYFNGTNGILRRLEYLESRIRETPSNLLFNISLLSRRLNRQSNLLATLRLQIFEIAKDHCQSRPCRNGGTCLNIVNGYHCSCPSNWEGHDCEIDVNECRNFAGTDLGCQNGATCLNRPGTYECLCRSGWFGLHCTRKAKDCSGGNYEMCGHGTCIPVTTGEGIKCICDQGWTTNGTDVACQTDINECDSSQGPRCSINPRVDCINLPGSFRCGQCPAGFEGDGYICSDINECLTVPNGGCSTSPMVTCHNTIGSRICGACPPGYQGDGITCSWRGTCSINRGGCHPSAQCIDNPALSGQIAQCVCPVGMDGDGIGIHGCYVSNSDNTTGCDRNPCGIHGQCHQLRTGYTCICFRGYGGAHCDASSDYCSSNPCFNGGTCRQDDNSVRGFRCECAPQYSGDLCHLVSKTCGGLLQGEEGNILYPLSNTTYNHNSRCAWVIQTDPSKVINVTFSKFNLESSPDCSYDFLQIHDGRSSASQLIGRFCGNKAPNDGNIISNHNQLYFWFRSDQTVSKDGFALHWTSIVPVCGGDIDASTHGHINSPGSPGNYPPDRDCYWRLFTTLGKRIQLHFFALDIESHPNCSFDFIAIYDGAHVSDPLLSQYCDSTQPAPVLSSSTELLIHFHSDSHGTGKGFQLSFAPTAGVPGCGGYYTDEKGELVSPSYDGKYLSGVLCEYKIKTSPDTKIRINFVSFQLENSISCRFDYLKIYDGPSSDSKLVGRFCGVLYPKSYTSTSNYLFMQFRTDTSLTSVGFKITYKSICQQTLLGDSGIIKSPGYPLNYPEDRECEYIIGTSPGKAIQLMFQDFDIEDTTYFNCRYDSVEIRSGSNINGTLLGRFCGGPTHIPPVQTSIHNYMYIIFKSDLSIGGHGFYANYTTIKIECGGIHTENTGLINHPSEEDSYNNDQSCTWMLIAPEGMNIKLTWNRFALENMPSCRSDYVELIEVDDNNQENILGKYCGTTTPPTITASTNRLKIVFESDSSIRLTGFSLSYAFLDAKSHCGGRFSRSHGNIYSPGWPNRYENGKNCIWTIVAPAGQQIKLSLLQFDLERPIRDKCDYGDYLEIRNGMTENAPLVGKYCGNFQSKHIVSFGNALYLRFHSDSYITGAGFKIEWDSTVTGCGGTLSTANGSISSPNYPEHYSENAECFYRIVTSAGSRIHIIFKELELESTLNCRDDHVIIYDGRDENAASLGKYCSMAPNLNHIETSTNYAYIKFRSDFYIGAKGFLLEYYTVCQNNVTGVYGVIESPGYPNNYALNLDCLWTINVPKGNKINITFSHFDTFKTYLRRVMNPWSSQSAFNSFSDSCSSDYMQIKELTDINFNKRYCGTTSPPRFTSRTNSLQIKFVTGGYYPRTGFRLEWARSGCGGHIQKSFGSLSLDRSLSSAGELECEWIIEVQPGKSITFTLADLYMSESVNCTTDAIEIYNGQSVTTPLLTKICHRGMSSVQSSSNFMLIRFVKQSSLKDVHFNAVFDSYQTGCGGRIESRFGIIQSKNYPKNYDDKTDCTWTLVVPYNHRVELNFIDFDLYSSSNNDESDCGDYINIYNGNFVLDSNYTQRICPNSRVSQIISKSNILGVQFISNDYGAAKGFKANFSISCGATIKANNDGIIMYDKYVTHYSNNCTWIVLAPSPDQKISLTITHMSIEKDMNIVTSRNCPSSYLRVFDGNDDSAPLIDEYCGRKVPPIIVSHGSAITIQLGAYNGSAVGHFTAHYSPLINACGGSLSSEEGTIASPNYPQSYPESASCEWTLSTSPGNKVYITFEQFDLDYSEHCNEDYLEIRENDGAGRLLGLYCSNEIPTNTTTASKLYIKFHSDSKNTGRGFLMHYGFLHGNHITGLESGQVTSPLYPNLYVGKAEYTWRIIVSDSQTITLTVNEVEIPVYGLICYNSLTVYDGYDDEAPLLDEFCGMMTNTKVLHTTSNVVFIKLKLDETNRGSTFVLDWAKGDKIAKVNTNKITCGTNETTVVTSLQSLYFTSPNYPKNYENDLNCEWVYKSSPNHHLKLIFLEFKIEQTPACFADTISIYSSEDSSQWKPIKENICTSDYVNQVSNATNYMKIKFKTDASVTQKGFKAKISSVCGGTITDLSGQVGPLWTDIFQNMNGAVKRCDWTIKVRPGRMIKLYFEHFNITNGGQSGCETFVSIRNGDSVEAPLLGIGKYCGDSHEKVGESIESSSNAIFVSYESSYYAMSTKFQTFRLRYEEKGIECGVTSTLDNKHQWEVINSPNYPSVSVPYSECVWKFTGPPGEILRIDFLDRFDIQEKDDCIAEYIEIREGSSDMSPLKGRFCGEKPGTIKTSSNIVHIKYLTQLSEPRNGFKANVSIDVCGGTIKASAGELMSPGYPHMQVFPTGSVCEWRLIGSPTQVFNIYPEKIVIPESESPCATKVTIEEALPVNNTIIILKTFCADEDNTDLEPIETFSNEIVIKLHIGKPSEWTQQTRSEGFKFTFNSSHPSCGETVTTPEGFLTTPGYPRETTIRYCHWFITVPNKGRRVRLELLDSDINTHKIGIFNDLSYQTIIQILPPKDLTIVPQIYESTENKLALYLWLDSGVPRHRFKAKFTSDEEALCGGTLTGSSGQLESPILNRSYTCEWSYNYQSAQIVDNNATGSNTVYVVAKVNSSYNRPTTVPTNRLRCRYSDARLTIKSVFSKMGYYTFNRNLCGNVDSAYRLPTTAMDIKSTKNNFTSLYFHLEWKVQPCGGVLTVGEKSMNILKIPNDYNDSIECAWFVNIDMEGRLELRLDGNFLLDCDDEFVRVTQGTDEFAPVLGNYCKTRTQQSPLVTSFRSLLIEYHSKAKNHTDIKVFAKTITNQCGGYLTKFDNIFNSPNYPKSYDPNVECTWEIKTEIGYRISLQFIERFVIEERANCSKDAVIIYDWKDDTYTEIARLCGRQPPAAINSTYNQMKIVLRTDNDINLDGFKALWSSICGGKYIATEKEQLLYSPGFPVQYAGSLDCNYEISSDKKIILKFLEFELEGTYPSCEYDNLTITASSSYESFVAIYCDTQLPTPTHNYEKVNVKFKTDKYIQRRGFKLSYSVYSCGGQIKDPTVLSSGPLSNYDNNLNCTWFIEAPDNKQVILKFQYIDLESNTECYTDFVAVYNGLRIDDKNRVALMCGKINTTTVLRSVGNKMLMQFVTDSTLSYTGFKVQVLFTYSEATGCGGQIEVKSTGTQILKSPLIGGSSVYENILDCHWTILAPEDYSIKIEFTSFHIASCWGVNQTALGMNKCDCDYVEVKNGINPDSFVMDKFCGHTAPMPIISSTNIMSVRFATDGGNVSTGFEARLSTIRSPCGDTLIKISREVSQIKSPGYDSGTLPRALHCTYHFDMSSEPYGTMRVTIKNLDLRPGEPDPIKCNKDSLTISDMSKPGNMSTGKDYIISRQRGGFYSFGDFDESTLQSSDRYVVCGSRQSVDFYLTGSVSLNLITSVDSDTKSHKGFDIEAIYTGFCGRNYTESQGRVKSSYEALLTDHKLSDCYTLITAPENSTISIYFLSVVPDYWNNEAYVEIFDGDKRDSTRLIRIGSLFEGNTPVFSTGRYVLLHHHIQDENRISYDFTYVSTDKGRGCGGKLFNLLGKITSPLYPSVYRRKGTCEWEIETPTNTRVRIRFPIFDMGRNCDQNYLKIVDRSGTAMSSFCDEIPADYISPDNYVKIVFTTTMNNGGTGWVLDFIAVL